MVGFVNIDLKYICNNQCNYFISVEITLYFLGQKHCLIQGKKRLVIYPSCKTKNLNDQFFEQEIVIIGLLCIQSNSPASLRDFETI